MTLGNPTEFGGLEDLKSCDVLVFEKNDAIASALIVQLLDVDDL